MSTLATEFEGVMDSQCSKLDSLSLSFRPSWHWDNPHNSHS